MAERISGAEALMRSLVNEGVETLFGYPGGAIMPVYDALYDYRDRLNHILVRHEQGAVHAAQGFARVSGKVGCAIVTSGPGATNTVTGIADAMIDSTPMVVICGQVGSSLLGTDAFQEVDVVGVTSPISKWSYRFVVQKMWLGLYRVLSILQRVDVLDLWFLTLPRMHRLPWWITSLPRWISFVLINLFLRWTMTLSRKQLR